MSTEQPVEHFFRHEYGKLVASLSRQVGVHNIELVEDAVQVTLLKALELWTHSGKPDNPSAWLFRVAKNEVLSSLRTHTGRGNLLQHTQGESTDGGLWATTPVSANLVGDVRDDLLRMLFVCCASEIDTQSQLVLALKTLCGFSAREIALRLFVSEAKVYKRLQRARSHLQQMPKDRFEFDDTCVSETLPNVRKVLYIIFTEGYLSSHAEFSIRENLCAEAIRLTTLLAEHSLGQSPETSALLALMFLQRARLHSRQDRSGGLLLLQEQDREKFDQSAIATGLWWLSDSARGDCFSRYHAEAGIAAEHCLSPSFDETRWDRVVSCYELLERTTPSAIHRLNRAVAIAEHKGPRAGLAVLEGEAPPSWLSGSYLWSAVLADFHARLGHRNKASRYRDMALNLASSPAIAALLRKRLDLSAKTGCIEPM